MPLRFLHTSDIHLLELDGVKFWRYFNKRLTGLVNLKLRRAREHDGRLFDAIIERAHELEVDRVVITGDLTNLALESEFAHVRDKLDGAGLPVTVIPGNHDAYTRGSARGRRFEAYLAHHMDGDRPHGGLYPFVQRFDDVALVGLSTAIASLPLYAVGRVGPEQLDRFEATLAELGREGMARVVLIHHPVMPGASKPRHDLLDLEAFAEVIARHGADLILHGHEHRLIEGTLPGPDSAVPVHGIGSGTSLRDEPGRRAAFSIYRIAPGILERELHVYNGAEFEPVGATVPSRRSAG